MGLLDNLANAPAESGVGNALLAAAQALLTPAYRGGGVGAAFGAMPAAMQQAQMQAMRQRLMELEGSKLGFEMDQARTKQQQAEQAAAARAGFLQDVQQRGGFRPDMMPAGVAAGFKPDELEKMASASRWGMPNLVNVGGVGVDPQTWQPVGAVQDPNKPFGAQMGPDGQLRTVANDPFQRFELGKASASAPRVDLKVENKMGESIAGQIGPMLRAGRERTEGAINLGRSGEEIIAALDSGQVIAGPGANLRIFGAQVADLLGVGGKDNTEKLQNTRRVVRGLADAAVEARKRLAGQGQVTENEAKAVEKASSGSIDDLTPEEIRLIAGLNVKAARLAARDYESQLGAMPDSMMGARPFYAIPGLERWTTETEAPSAPAATTRRRFNPATGRLE